MTRASVFWGTHRDSSRPWPACRLDDDTCFFSWPDERGVWWPSSYAGGSLRRWAERGERVLLREDYARHLMALVGYDGPGAR